MRHSLSSLAAAEIDTLEAEGIRLTAHEVIHIAALCERLETPGLRRALARGVPVPIGGVHLWPLTLYAADWWQRIGDKLRTKRQRFLALAYAMANGRKDLPETISEAARAVRRWVRKLKCREAELKEAVTQIQAQDAELDTEDGGEPATFGDISLMLTAMTGTRPEVWERQCGIPYVLDMLNTIVAHNNADGSSSVHDPRIRAERAIGLCVERIRKRHLREQAESNGDKDS